MFNFFFVFLFDQSNVTFFVLKQRKFKAADNFGTPVLKLAHAIQLPFALLRVKQYCLHQALAASFKSVA